MPHAERSVVIERPLSMVFAFFADAENDRQWRPAVKEITRTGEVGVGATYRQRVAGPGGRPVPADIETTAYEEGSRVAFKGTAGPVRPTGEYRFRDTGSGTEVTFRLDVELGGLKGTLLGRPVQRAMDGEMANLDRAKQLLESR